MDKNTAIKLLEDTFGKNYNRDRFCRFIKEIFNKFNINVRTWKVWDEYEEFIERYSSLGTFIDKNNRVIEVIEVKLKRASSRDRARTMQRNFIAKFLKAYDKDAALVAFYGDDPTDWRFSFVKLEYDLEKGELLTPAKRYSYLVGTNEPNHTARRQLLDLLIEENKLPTLEILEQAFSIEKVTKEFFNEYKELFLELKEEIENIININEDVRNEFKEKHIEIIDFSKHLLGQIVFLYFVQKKGWLGVSRDTLTHNFKNWGEGPKDFMRRLFEKKIVDYNNFFNDILEPLFYEALARPREDEDSYYSKFDCKIPFLNGGLFEPINGYSWYSVDILIPNSIFSKILKTFDTYNFTVKEDEPLEKEVAVDPEMLGKVFENLLEVKDRKSKGAFYTPREIVHYMCQQSLIEYLVNNTNIDRKDIERYIHFGDFAVESDKRIPESVENQYQKIDDLLKDIKIVDPAVGSGAFLVGMMNEIVKARVALTPLFEIEKQKIRLIYNLKREAIENNLYGVDIEPSAVDIAQLRFWLSLIVDEESIDEICPLPNLDHKIMCGDSLLQEFEEKKLFDDSILAKPLEDKSYLLEHIEKEKNRMYKEFHDIHTGKRVNNGRAKEIESELKKLEKRKKEIQNAQKNNENQQMSLHSALNIKIIESMRQVKKLRELYSDFFNEQNREKKKIIEQEIEKNEWNIIEKTLEEQGNEEAIEKLRKYKKIKSKPFFLWRLFFSDIFERENPGFDIVIANPPYVRQEEIKEYKQSLRGKYEIFVSTGDLYTYFYEKGINLLRKDGILTFISSNKFMRAKYGKHLRNFLKKATSLQFVIDFGEKHMFEAITNTCIVITKKGYDQDNMLYFSNEISINDKIFLKIGNLSDFLWVICQYVLF